MPYIKFNGFYHFGIFVYLVNMSEYASLHLYEDAYKMEFNWEKWLPRKVYEYHDLNYREVNAPVSLQMGVLLPFISLLCGPKTKGHFLTRPSCINLFCRQVPIKGEDDIPTSSLHDGKSRSSLARFQSI